ncbi:Uncharacterized protein DAT39_006714, partial [Clarias magur]
VLDQAGNFNTRGLEYQGQADTESGVTLEMKKRVGIRVSESSTSVNGSWFLFSYSAEV